MRHFSNDESNVFTVPLKDVIVPPLDNENSSNGESDLIFDQLFLIQDYFGNDIAKLINEKNKMLIKEEHILIIIYNVLCALHFLHSANVVHRDLKPANILINDCCNVRLCDFGLARTVKSDHSKKDSPSRRRSSKLYDAKQNITNQLTTQSSSTAC